MKRVNVVRNDKPSLAMAMIAKDAEATIGACLASFMPYVRQCIVMLDDRSTDKTAKIARKMGAEVHPFHMCQTHTCDRHGTIEAQHFARARNLAMEHLDPDLAWWAWADSDDVILRANLLPALCQHTPDEAIGLWAEYVYAYATRSDGQIVPTTAFHRERVFRTRLLGEPVKWEWQYRVHEVCAPQLRSGQQARWLINNELVWRHQAGAHKSESSAARNLTLLEIDYEENPRDSRTLFYIGNQYFAQQQWLQASFWYEKLLEVGSNTYENWQAQIYACKAYQRLGALDAALRMAYGALHTEPRHPEAYLALCEVYSMQQDDQKVVFWTHAMREMQAKGLVKEPPFFVFKASLDKTFNHHLPLADALARLGRLGEARAELEQAATVLDDARVSHVIESLKHQEQDIAAAEAFGLLAAATGDPSVILSVYGALPDSVKSQASVRDLAIPLMQAARVSTNGVAA